MIEIKTDKSKNGTIGKGFTVAELILVVAVLAIMASIAIPRMGWATMGKVQSKTAARQFANYLKLTRSLAIMNASSNDIGYSLQLSASEPYTSYEIENEATGTIIKGPIAIPTGVTCTGDYDFKFTPLGQLYSSVALNAQFSKASDTSVVTVTPTGRITVQ